MEILRGIHERQLAKYKRDMAAARHLVSTGDAERPGDLEVSELAAWTAIGNVLLNLDETITKR